MSIIRFFFLFVLSSVPLFSNATLPDSLVITDFSWSAEYGTFQYNYLLVNTGKDFQVYQTYSNYKSGLGQKEQESQVFKKTKLGKVSNEKIAALTTAVLDTNFSEFNIQNFGYDMSWISANTNKLISYLEEDAKQWTSSQLEFVKEQLTIEANYNEALKREIGKEGIYYISKHSSTKFNLTFYYKNCLPYVVSAAENPLGMPWKTGDNYSRNPNIPEAVLDVLPKNESFNRRKFEPYENLISALVQSIYDDECKQKMYDLAPLAFTKELNELKDTFEILNMTELGYRGRYVWDVDHVYKISLKNDQMNERVFLQYLVSKQGKTLYSRDSLLKESHSIIERVQSVDFLMKYLDENPSRKIDIYYFDNNAMNEYVLDGFNTNPVKWAEYEKYDGNKGFLNLYCGCNLRLDHDYLLDAIFFELFDEFGKGSIWILLPDNTPLLHYFEGQQVYNYSYQELGTQGVSVQYACKKFDKNGKIIP